MTTSIASGVSYAVSAGNSGANACATVPARLPAALTVGATDRNDVMPACSNFGACVDLFAPGVNIVSDAPGGGSATKSGTSMASPHVAGEAAAYLSQNPLASPASVAAAITGNASAGKITGLPVTPASPNLLLYSNFIGSPPDPPVLTVTPSNQRADLAWTVPVVRKLTDHGVQHLPRRVAGD